jgi:hypothetical protein
MPTPLDHRVRTLRLALTDVREPVPAFRYGAGADRGSR